MIKTFQFYQTFLLFILLSFSSIYLSEHNTKQTREPFYHNCNLLEISKFNKSHVSPQNTISSITHFSPNVTHNFLLFPSHPYFICMYVCERTCNCHIIITRTIDDDGLMCVCVCVYVCMYTCPFVYISYSRTRMKRRRKIPIKNVTVDIRK